jgi:uncharacterized membrane protein YtjA (UPF0391 family)
MKAIDCRAQLSARPRSVKIVQVAELSRSSPVLSERKRRFPMLYYALVFLVVALIAGVLGFGGIAGASASIAQVLFFIFVVLFVVSLAMRLLRR